MNSKQLSILLADDDTDDCTFFKEAVNDLSMKNKLTTVHDGEKLMHLLNNESHVLPDVLFLDLNMPRKNGFECLAEIKRNKRLKDLHVVIFSTSFEQEVVNQLFESGAQHFIRKPSEFTQYKKIIQYTIEEILNDTFSHNNRKVFVISLPGK